jgi:hypothetical protein
VIIRIRMSCFYLQTATPEICIVKWMRSSRVVEATDSKVATVLGSIPVSSDTVESHEGRHYGQASLIVTVQINDDKKFK